MEITCRSLFRPLLNVLSRKKFVNESGWLSSAVFRKSSTASSCITSENEPESKLPHLPVMKKEVIEALNLKEDGVYIDMTFGSGGHSQAIIEAAPNIKLYCLDRDPVAHNYAKRFAEEHGEQVTPLLGRFSELNTILMKLGVPKESIDGILIDAGCSSMQFDEPARGFSLSQNGPLDMRMDGSRFPDHPTAADVVNTLDFPSLARVIKYYGEEKRARRLAQAIIDARFMLKSLRTTQELADLVFYTIGYDHTTDKVGRHSHSATKVFQAFRIFVNNELNELYYGIKTANSYLKENGRMVTMSFHSLEDRIIKRCFHDIDMDEPISQSISQKYSNAGKWHAPQEMNKILQKEWLPLYKSVLVPSIEEVSSNPRSRSAKLRFAAKKRLM